MAELKEAKGTYRSKYDQLVEQRALADDVQQAVEQCRAQLLTDFSTYLQAEHPEAAGSAASIAAALSSATTQPTSASARFATGASFASGDMSFEASSGGGLSFGTARGSATARLDDTQAGQLDEVEQFNAMETRRRMAEDPGSVPFFEASKLASAKATKGAQGGAARMKSRPPFQ